METYFTYLLQSTLSVAVLFIAYKLLFANRGFFDVNRLVLFSVIGFGFVGPYLATTFLSGLGSSPSAFGTKELSNQLAAINLQEIVVNPFLSTEQGISLIKFISIIYLVVCAVYLLRLLFNAALLFSLYLKSETLKSGGFVYVLLPEGSASFSFFNLLFLDKSLIDDGQGSGQIIRHEKIHFQQLHSVDIILVELLLVFQWFNPLVYYLRKAVIENNEYLADQKTIDQTANKSDYKLLLLKNTLQQQTYFLTNNFSYSLIKKRIKMMEKEKSKLKLLISAFAFLLVFVAISVSCSNEMEQAKEAPEEKVVTTITKELPDVKAADEETPGQQVNITVVDDEVEDPVFKVVEVQPIFPGGQEAMYQFLGDNISYPEKAKKDNVSGRVFVNFIVEKDGSVTNVKVLRGIGSGCDEEAARVVSMMPDWTPGTQKGKAVRVSYNLPIKFALK